MALQQKLFINLKHITMFDLKTGRFVLNEMKGWELRPFMTKEEFINSDLFQSEYIGKNKEYKPDDWVFNFGLIEMNGEKMFLSVCLHRTKGYVDHVKFASERTTELRDENRQEENDRIADEISKLHKSFLEKETSEKGEWCWHKDWGELCSCAYGTDPRDGYPPQVYIELNYMNLTKDDIAELDKMGDEIIGL